jgi:hypothetical protein
MPTNLTDAGWIVADSSVRDRAGRTLAHPGRADCVAILLQPVSKYLYSVRFSKPALPASPKVGTPEEHAARLRLEVGRATSQASRKQQVVRGFVYHPPLLTPDPA